MRYDSQIQDILGPGSELAVSVPQELRLEMVENMSIPEVNQKTAPLSELDFIMGDKLAFLITVKLGWSPVRVGITAYVFAVSLSILIALVTGTLTTQDEVIGLADVVHRNLSLNRRIYGCHAEVDDSTVVRNVNSIGQNLNADCRNLVSTDIAH